ncbi:MAG: serpin family protein, partial [Oscillospiraceae bacterium]|nr:serpin family protein [Oscillospiraceae bacterium]
MRKFKIMSILTAGVCGAAILAGCVTKPANTDTNGTPFTVSEVSAKELQAPQYAQSIAAEQVAAGANDFAFRLSAALSAEYTGENFVCSPYSVWLPLAALLNATNDASKPALLEALGAAGISAENVNKAASRMLYDLTRLRDKENEQYDENFKYRNPLQIAN